MIICIYKNVCFRKIKRVINTVYDPLEQMRSPVFHGCDKTVDKTSKNYFPLFEKYCLEVQENQWRH